MCGRVINSIKLTLPSYSVNEGIARGAVSAFCAQLDPTAAELGDIKCALSEAVTNCIVHAYRDTIGDIYISVDLLEGSVVRIKVKDRGCGIEDVKCARMPLYTTDRAGERSGMGFTVMESFTDSMRVSSSKGKGTTVTLYKKIEGR
ncbi:MAG: anti-sigma F factor [Clostridia bacterium]|nr:anti-sigma F factor [Clostridia bacterium]